MNGHAIREAAKYVSHVVQDGICRKGAGEPYSNHTDRVADAMWGWQAKAIAHLHDTVEDAKDPKSMEQSLRVIFPKEIVDAVMILSRLPDSKGKKITYEEFIQRVIDSGDKDTIGVKLADVTDNLHDIEDIPGMQYKAKQYSKAKIALEEALEIL